MNKNIFKIIIGVIVILVIIVGTMYLIDLDRMKNGEEVVFSTWGAKYAPVKKEQLNENYQKYSKTINNVNLELNNELTYDEVKELLEIIKTVNITYNSILDFEILFYNKALSEGYEIYTILDKSETDKYDYNIYGYDGIVNIKINGNEYSLKEALLENKITMEEIIEKAIKDEKEGKITSEMYI